ncbi:hypothetical protein GGR53DRAFT_489769 [Hypoxylon sp. FL1150]|nr:hypothetical protein GGR53DRAFT_489769 [Hypoxylon sp. FL1150]
MDDDGDIWYDCDDGDRYYDAREYQPDEEAKNWLAEFCPMCQRPEWYHLRNKEVAEEAKLTLLKYRKKLKDSGRRFFY